MVRFSLMALRGAQLARSQASSRPAGDTAARRRAITELLFFASTGDLARCQRIVRLWNLKVRRLAEAACCLHAAAAVLSVRISVVCHVTGLTLVHAGVRAGLLRL